MFDSLRDARLLLATMPRNRRGKWGATKMCLWILATIPIFCLMTLIATLIALGEGMVGLFNTREG